MENQTSWSNQLKSIGLMEFSASHRKILAELQLNGVSTNYAALVESSAEALIQAVSVMIEENNKALLTELSQ